MNVTLDGFMSGENCELDWHFQSWTTEMAECLCEELSKADTILLGRITYNAMAKYWPLRSTDLSYCREDIAFAELMNSYRKIVISKTLSETKWNNTQVVKKNLEREIMELKKQPGKNVIIYGSCKLVAALMRMNLIDEYQVWIHPVLLGKGKPLFNQGILYQKSIQMRLYKTRTFSSGVAVLYYQYQ